MNGSDYDNINTDNESECSTSHEQTNTFSNYVEEVSTNVKVYLLSVFTATYMNMPTYIINTIKWVKMAVIDAPIRIGDDIDNQYNKITRHLSGGNYKETSDVDKEA